MLAVGQERQCVEKAPDGSRQQIPQREGEAYRLDRLACQRIHQRISGENPRDRQNNYRSCRPQKESASRWHLASPLI